MKFYLRKKRKRLAGEKSYSIKKEKKREI